jgi:hypothetical protein
MLNRIKFTAPALFAAALVSVAATSGVQATTLNGGIDITGTVSGFNLLGQPDVNLLTCLDVALGAGHLNQATESGIFAGLNAVAGINLLSGPIICNPIVIPPLLQQFSLGAYTFDFLTVGLSGPLTANAAVFGGVCIITDTSGDIFTTTATLDINANLGFDLSCGDPGSGNGNPVPPVGAVPDAGTSVALFGFGLTALGMFGRFHKSAVTA